MNMSLKIWLTVFITIILSHRNEAAINVELQTSDFVNISKSGIFVDKTSFIRAIFEERFSLVTAPRRFGKSTNMDMLKTFVEFEVDKNGHPIANSEGNETKNCKFFKDREFNIYKENKKFFYDHCGAHPVLYVDFIGLSVADYERFVSSFRIMLNQVFRQYGYLVEKQKDDDNNNNDEWIWSNYRNKDEAFRRRFNASQFIAYYDEVEILKLDEQQIRGGLKYLSEVLKGHFGRKVFVLIDEYDAPIIETIYENTVDDSERIFNFIGSMIFDLLNNTESVGRGLINARVQLARVLSPRSDNILVTYEFLGHHRLYEFYGFTSSEITKLVQDGQQLGDVKLWYEGYAVLGKKNVTIFNPWSVANYLKSGQLDKYWASAVGTYDLKRLLSHPYIREQIDHMLNERALRIHLEPIMDINDVKILKCILQHPENSEVVIAYSDLFFRFFYESGYFNVIEKDAKGGTVLIRIPNVEIQIYFQKYL